MQSLICRNSPSRLFPPREYRRGDLVTGEIVRIDDEGMVISAGLKTEGIVPPQEMRTLPTNEESRWCRAPASW